MAEKWLAEKNTNNRPLSSQTVTSLARAIERGEWQLTHQGIAFDEDGLLVDGQHRLAAIKKAGVPVRISVTHGVPRSAFAVMDTGRKRTGRDALSLAGESNGTHLAAALRGLHLYLTQPDSGWSGGTSQVTHLQLLSLLEEHPGMRTAITQGLQISRAIKITVTAASIGWYVTRRERPEVDQTPWREGLITGAGLQVGDPRLTLRNTMLDLAAGKRHRKSDDSREHLLYYLKAWNAWVEGRQMKLLRRSPKEAMPKVSKKGGNEPNALHL
ncbi:hypothetical protein [Saccharomonospora cyanea]|nr:hypothetical protein [Saccharomonospora cyanea]